MAEFYGVDLGEVREVEHGGVTWRLRPVPAVKYAILRQAFVEAHRPIAEAPEGEREAASERQAEPVLRAAVDLVRWGVAGAVGATLATERERFAGVEHEVLARGVAEKLVRVRSGGLVIWLTHEVLKTNDLDEQTLLGFQ